MDPAAPLASWVVLGVALVALAAVVTGLALSRRGAPAPPRREEEPPPPERPPGPHWAVDDLPGFLEAPPGTPVPETRPAEAPAPAVPQGPDPSARTVAALAAAGLALVVVLAGVALGSSPGAPVTGGAPPAATPGPSTPPASPTTARPELPPVPADPLPGERGAGLLAARSVPLGGDGVAARLALGGLVLERRAVGVTVGYPSVSVSVGSDGTALAHVLLPTWNCLGTTAPGDPEAAGCTPVLTEYADLPTPALTVTRDGDALRFAGRFPTYTRPTATPPAYTGRVYDLSVTVAPAGGLDGGEAPADGTLFLGTERAEALADPALSRIRVAG
ncbi:hypothetical protein ACI798_10060 [Geodermatophilus sp. SYSU D01045]